jgi:hypothetical protein
MARGDRSRLLRLALRGNALFSIASGVAMVVAGRLLAEELGGLSAVEFAVLGSQLALFGAFVAWLAARPVIPRATAVGIIAGDLAWVLASAAVLVFPPASLTFAGKVAVAACADVVAVFAILQIVGVRRLRSEQALGA